MPELPEVQTTVNGLQLIIKHNIKNIKINTKKLRYLIPKNLNKITNKRKILKIYRIAKYIIFDLSGNISLFLHLGMSGRLKLLKIKDYTEDKHDHLIIDVNINYKIIFNDPRKFGFLGISKSSFLMNNKHFINLGLDPFDEKFNKNYLLNKFKNSKSPIKQLLLNQKIISGIGNIYACEILFDAKISPFIPANKLNIRNIQVLIISIKKILYKAIVSGGTSIKDYVSVDGMLGNFQNHFKVYNQNKAKNLKFKVMRIKQSGRSTFYCPKLQKSSYNPKLK